ncbi:MAG: undecaprenyl-diphosphate phosphatase [Clostridia bacterium]|nr:undecaprenyl-diphosphate phosphatase [Clostridia bacterium]
MNFWQALVLGAVQGLTEFLPVSSSGHLLLVQQWLNIDVESNLLLSVLLHLGTLVAVSVVLHKYVFETIKNPKKLLLWVVASVPAGLIGFLFSDILDKYLYSTKVLPYTFLTTAVVLLVCQYVAKRTQKTYQVNTKIAIFMGIGQALAVIPGLSRSGCTISAGVFAKGEKEEVAKFSFLMSIPVILGSLLLQVVKIALQPKDVVLLGSTPWYNLATAVATSAIMGIIAIKLLLKLIQKADYKWFSVYLTALAIVLFII